MIRSRCRVVASMLLAGVVAVCSPPAFALNPRLDISQYGHTAWRISDGFSVGLIQAIAQTTDGYLWLGTNDGLFRFDGMRATRWQPPDQPLPSNNVRNLATTRDGSLWIGTDRGLVSWKDGTLTFHQAPEMPYRVGQIVQDRDGIVWAPVGLEKFNRWVLCAFTTAGTECHGTDGGAGVDVISVLAGPSGTLWAGTATGVWRWKPAPARFFPVGRQSSYQGMAEDAAGALLITRPGRIDRLVDGRIETLFRFPAAMSELRATRILPDRDGALWLGTPSAGLLHAHQGVLDFFGEAEGLSSNVVTAMHQDVEGSIWVATAEGLHRFRDLVVAPVSTRQGLPSSRANAFLASPDGSVWMSTSNGLARVIDDEVIVYRRRGASGPAEPRISRRIRYVEGGGLPPAQSDSIFRDRRGRVWAGTGLGAGYVENDRFVDAPGVPGGVTRGISEDGEGTIWIANEAAGVLRLRDDGSAPQATPWTALGQRSFVTAIAGDPRRGVWLGFNDGGLLHFDGTVQRAHGSVDRVSFGTVHNLHVDGTDTLWIASQAGLTRRKNGRFATLNTASGLPCNDTQWALSDDAGAMWLAMPCGLVRVDSSEMAAWNAATDRQDTSRRVQVTVYGNADGYRHVAGTEFSAPAVKAKDGRLWFWSYSGAFLLDPKSLPSNRLAPAVHIESVTADRKRYEPGSNATASLRLPPLTRDLEIDYTALSLVAPERNQFRYRLDGRDTGWQDVGSRRQAYYSDLAPGLYTFRVIASNNDGVWNDTGASIDFDIAPAYYQTTWFMALVAGMLLTLVWAAHRIRLRIVEIHEREITALNEKLMSAQEQERIRIAGELHDGVMQEMLAATMMLGAAKRRLGDTAQAEATIDKVQQKLVQAGTEIRQLSHDLHPPALQEQGLPDALRSHCEQYSASCGIPIVCDADDRVHELSRGAALALFRIVQEALGNAAKHSRATRITVGLMRSGDEVTLTVSDNGAGFDRSRLTTSGGLGLITMRERAGQLNGKFEFNTATGRGTTITVVIPFR